jgi:serine/threonine-protein kinase
MIGQLLDGRYQIIRALGAGGFGHTYIAEDTRIPGNPICVVKHLKPASSDPSVLQTARRLFHSEAEILAQIGNHPQIPRLLAYFEEEREFYLVQEFIDGHLLTAELLPNQPWTEDRVIDLLQDVLGILEFVHRQGVIHRDVKPGNLIRRDADRKLVLIDFGAIKQVQTQLAVAMTGATVAIGTPGYMPTEQGRGKPRPNSDLYALGVIAIQALTGLQPTEFPEDPDTGEIVWQKLVRVSPRLAAVVTKMTHYHFKDRYQTASEALQAVRQLGGMAESDNAGYVPTEAISRTYAPPPSYFPPTTPVTPISQPQKSGWGCGWPLLVAAVLTAAIAGLTATSPYWWRRISSNSQGNSPGTSSTTVCTVAIAQLNVRSRPGGDVIERLDRGTSISLTGKQESVWVEISAPRSGWVGSRDKQGKKLIDCPADSGINVETVPLPAPSPNSSSGDNTNKTPRRKKKQVQQPTPTPSATPTPTPTPSPIPTDSPTPTPTPVESPIPIEIPTPSESPIPIEVPTPIETLLPTPIESLPLIETPIPIESPSP